MSSQEPRRAVVRPRQVAMYLAKVLTPEVPRDRQQVRRARHSTVIHAVRLIEDLRTRDADMDGDLCAACCASGRAEQSGPAHRRGDVDSCS